MNYALLETPNGKVQAAGDDLTEDDCVDMAAALLAIVAARREARDGTRDRFSIVAELVAGECGERVSQKVEERLGEDG